MNQTILFAAVIIAAPLYVIGWILESIRSEMRAADTGEDAQATKGSVT